MCFFPILTQSASENTLPLGFILMLTGINLVFFIPGFLMFWFSTRKKERCSGSVTGTIIDFGRAHSGSGTQFYPIYEYTVNGKSYTEKSRPASPCRMKVGDKRTIRYDPADPTCSYIEGYDNRSLRIIGLVFMSASLLLLLLGMLCGIIAVYAA